MKHHFSLGVVAILLLSACGGPDGDDTSPEDVKAAWAAEDVANDAAEAKDIEWATSDARPVNLACMEPDFERGQVNTFISLNSPTYPSVQAKSDQFVQRLRDLTPTTVELTPAEAKAYEETVEKLAALNLFRFMMGIGNQVQGQVVACNHESYESDGCTTMARVMGDKFAVENVVKDGDALSFTNVIHDEDTRTDVNMVLGNPDYDTLSMALVEDGVTTSALTFARDKTGEEQASGTLGPNSSFRYRETPDCAGELHAEREHEKGRAWVMDFTWTSVRADYFQLTYRDCRESKTGEMECKIGAL